MKIEVNMLKNKEKVHFLRIWKLNWRQQLRIKEKQRRIKLMMKKYYKLKEVEEFKGFIYIRKAKIYLLRKLAVLLKADSPLRRKALRKSYLKRMGLRKNIALETMKAAAVQLICSDMIFLILISFISNSFIYKINQI